MKRIILLILLMLSCAWTLAAQNKKEAAQIKCPLGVDKAPELRGFQLGTPQASVLARFPGTSIEKPDKFGRSQLSLTVIDTGTQPKGMASREKAVQPDMTLAPGAESGFIVDSARFPALKGVRRVRLQFTEARLSYMQLSYDDSVKWNSIDEFVETVALKLSLPGEWNLPADNEGSRNQKELRCEGFVITGDVSADFTDTRIAARLSVEDLVAAKSIEKRQNDLKEKADNAEDEKRKNFKP